jgi:hypothetical protein
VEDDKLTQAELDELAASFSGWAPNLTTFNWQLEWVDSQDVQILKFDRDLPLDDYVVTIHYIYSNPLECKIVL